jgi:hypothetical protein
MYDVMEKLVEAGYQYEFEYGDYDYSWTITQVYTRDGHVFNLEDSGCSCFGFGDNWNDVNDAIGAMTEVTRAPGIDDVGVAVGDLNQDAVIEKYRALGLR